MLVKDLEMSSSWIVGWALNPKTKGLVNIWRSNTEGGEGPVNM